MSENLDLVRSIYAASARGQFDVEWADPQIELVIADGPSPGVWKGVTQVVAAWRERINTWEGLRVVADELRELDEERVLVLTRGAGGRAKISGVDVRQIQPNAGAVYHIHDGKVTRTVLYFDRDRMLADLGLAPETRDGTN
jgi:ketosteroid isomerase-like protein